MLCFDDLERASIPIREMMGYINQYVEHKRVKTLILCNEDAIDSGMREDYRKFKEKLIGQTIQFHLDEAKVVDSVMTKLDDKSYRDFLQHDRDDIILLFQKSQTFNIRILMQGLSSLHTLFSAITSEFPKPSISSSIHPACLAVDFRISSGPCK